VANKDQYKAADFIEAIKGSGGIVSTIARRVSCQWHTAKKYIDNYATVAQAYEDERASNRDMAHSVLVRNIQLALKAQEETGKPVDSSDAKWYLSRLDPEFKPKQEQDITSGGEQIRFIVGGVDLEKDV